MNDQATLIAHQIANGKVESLDEVRKTIVRLQSRGIKSIEFDARQTMDGGFVIAHDKQLPLFVKPIIACTLSELKREGQRKNFLFLTLGDALKIIPAEFQINVHLKDAKVDVKKLIEILRPFQIFDQLIISTNYPKTLVELAQSEIKKRWLITSISRRRSPIHLWHALRPIKTALACQATGIAPHYQLVTRGLIKKAHQKNLTVAAWTINKEEDIKRLTKWGIDWLISDRPLRQV